MAGTSVTGTLQLVIFPLFPTDILAHSVISELYDNSGVKKKCQVSPFFGCVCVDRPFWPQRLLLCRIVPLWRGENLSVSIVWKPPRETLSCFTVISQPSTLITVRGQRVQDDGRRTAKKWAQTQNAPLSIPSSPPYYSLFGVPLVSRRAHRDTTLEGLFTFMQPQIFTHFLTFSILHCICMNSQPQTHTNEKTPARVHIVSSAA